MAGPKSPFWFRAAIGIDVYFAYWRCNSIRTAIAFRYVVYSNAAVDPHLA